MVEGNYLQKDRSSRIAINGLFLAGSPILYKEIKKKNKKVATIIGIGLVLGNGYLIYHNLRLMRNK